MNTEEGTNSSDKKLVNVILAPHPDDEVIGCFSVLEKDDIDYVIYFSGDKVRRDEAMMCARSHDAFMFTSIFVTPRTMFDDEALYNIHKNFRINTLYTMPC